MSLKKIKSLRSKFVQILLFVSGLMGVATTAIVVLMSAQASAENFASIEQHIQEGIISKGRVLTKNHALALRSLTVDNAFLDIQGLVEHAVHDDQDLVYGIFINSEGVTLAKTVRGELINRTTGRTLSPDKDAWRAIGLKENELLVSAPSVERKTRLGQELLEVAVPVVSEEAEPLGTIRYGLSTRRMQEALINAKTETTSRLQHSVLWIMAMVSVAMLLGLLLSRAQAVRITKPIGVLTRAAESLASGDRSVRVDIDSGDELSVLGDSFNHMVAELASSYRALEQLNQTLEQQVEARTAELGLANRDMRLVLDNVDQGFVMLSLDGRMASARSAIVSRWFGNSECPRFVDYMEAFSPRFGVAFRLGWEQLVDDYLPLEVCLAQLPAQLWADERSFSFRYLAFYREHKLEGVLVVIADVTERLLREREEAEHSELMHAFKKLMLDRSGFAKFLSEAGAMVHNITKGEAEADMPGLKRTLHTLKGNAGMMGMTVVAHICHTLETQLEEDACMQKRSLSELVKRWAAIGDHVSTFLGNSGVGVIEIPEAEYRTLVSQLSSQEPASEVLHQLISWQLEPVVRPLTRLGDQAKTLGLRLGKGEINVEVKGTVRLDPQIWTPFFSELVHVITNAVDHGIETPEQREAAAKSSPARLQLSAVLEGDTLSFEVTDDGRGIDWASIAERAKRLHLPHASHAELVNALCTDGVTTKNSLTEISGRGVGMAAFQRRVRAMHGRLEVSSTLGKGTSLIARFRVPAETGYRPLTLGTLAAVS